MTEMSTGQKADAQEPSMEDILASIRRILSEDSAAPLAKPAGGQAAKPTPPPAEPDDLPPPDLAADFADGVIGSELAGHQPTGPDGSALDGSTAEFDHDPLAGAAFMDPPSAVPGIAPPAPPYAAAPRPPHGASPADDVLLLSADMRAPPNKLVSPETAADSADVLSQLARAILDRRDMAVGGHTITLESMIREMLRPLLREWLDRNLPYLIERLVRKEIDLMVNRAERLED